MKVLPMLEYPYLVLHPVGKAWQINAFIQQCTSTFAHAIGGKQSRPCTCIVPFEFRPSFLGYDVLDLVESSHGLSYHHPSQSY